MTQNGEFNQEKINQINSLSNLLLSTILISTGTRTNNLGFNKDEEEKIRIKILKLTEELK